MKRTVIFCAVLAAALAADAMLDDDAALAAARATLAKLTLREKTRLLAGSGTMTLPAVPGAATAREWTMSDSSSTVRASLDRWGWDYVEPQTENTRLPSLSALAQT